MAAAVQKFVARLPHLAKGAQEYAVPRLNTFWKYAKVEMKPPTPSEWPQIAKGFENLIQAAKTQKWKQMTVKEAFLNAVVAAEIACWFFVGECIGKGSIIGYQIEGATNFELHF